MLLVVVIVLVILVIVTVYNTARVVPQKSAFVVERLGKYNQTLEAGFHILMPFIDRVAYKLSLKEEAIDVPPQVCITRDNVSVEVDGILYLRVMDPMRAAYGITNYRFASIQLAMTTMRSEIGKLDLDRTFVERESINGNVVTAVDQASDPWGVKVTRYEIKNITPPNSVQEAMEKQMRAEREKRAEIAHSEGERQARINRAEGERQQMIAISEGEKRKRINEADGRGAEIERVATATATGIREISRAIIEPGGQQAVNLRIAEQWIGEFGKLAQTNNTMIVPQNLSDIAGTVAALTKVAKESARTAGPGTLGTTHGG
jgi:regulator of protease activity HflC (stomatin/prohibitin superfamily)